MLFKLEIDMNDPSFSSDPQVTLAVVLMHVGYWIRELPAPLQSGASTNLYGNGGDIMPPIGKAEFVPAVPPFKKK
jgi:hypothetical protein